MVIVFSSIFLIAVLLTTCLRLWLSGRHLHHVVSHRENVPPQFAESISLAAHQKAADYTVAKLRLGRIEVVFGSLYMLLLTFGGVLQVVHEWWEGIFLSGSVLHGTAFLTTLGVLGWLFDLPFSLYRHFVVEERFEFNKLTPRLFISDTLKQIGIAALIGLPILATVLWLMGRMGSFWWIYVWGFWLGFSLLAHLVWPIFIAPLFNKFTPLADESLKTRIVDLLTRCGFRASGIFVMDGSKRSSHGNAYFTGFGAAKRIVFFDTLVERLSPPEVEAVLAHELGHYKLHHIWKGMALTAILSLAFLYLLGSLIGESWFFNGLGMTAHSNAAALALFSIALPVFLFPLSPLSSLLSRKHEFEADAYAAQHAHASDLVNALVKLYRDNASTLTPDPLYSTFYDSHPPAAIRIAHLGAHPTAGTAT